MTITLSPELERQVREKVARGEYETPDALIGEALERLIEEQEEEAAHQSEILRRVDTAEAEIDSGDFLEYDEHNIAGLARDIHQRGLKRLAAERENTKRR